MTERVREEMKRRDERHAQRSTRPKSGPTADIDAPVEPAVPRSQLSWLLRSRKEKAPFPRRRAV